MGAKLTKEVVLERFEVAHGDRFEIPDFEFKGVDSKIEVICRVHGSFMVTPYQHIKNKSGCCPACGHALRNKTKFERLSKSFVRDSHKIHGGLYDYSKFIYVSATTKGIIICKVEGHGEFLQNPNAHKSGRGCPECARITWSNQQEKGGDFENFKRRCLSVGRTEFEINSCGFVRTQDKIELFCHIHGTYRIVASAIADGLGCTKCSDVRAGLKRLGTTEEFVARAEKVHAGERVNYDNTIFKGARKKVTMYCNTCESYFTQNAFSHLMGCGCPGCAKGGYDSTKPGILYYLKVGDSAYKIGITNRTVGERFTAKELESIKVIREVKYESGEAAHTEEQRIIGKYREFKWDGPSLLRSGNSELFDRDVLGLDT